MRLDRYLSLAGAGSRSEVKEMIRRGAVLLQGKTVRDPGAQVSFSESVFLKGQEICLPEYEYWIMNKPAGVLTAVSDRSKPTVMGLLPTGRTDLSPVGRLDEDTEGLLLITNDGVLTHKLIGPGNHAEKKYYAEVTPGLPERAGELLESPMDLGDFVAKPAVYEKLGERAARLTVTEGKFHQVRRMFQKIGCTVVYLRREAFGPLTLAGLRTGESRRLTEEEIETLKCFREDKR